MTHQITVIVANLKCEAEARISVLGQVIWLLQLDRAEQGRAFSCLSASIRVVKCRFTVDHI